MENAFSRKKNVDLIGCHVSRTNDDQKCFCEMESRVLIEYGFYYPLHLGRSFARCASLHQYHWRVLTAKRRNPTQVYQVLQWQATTESIISGLVHGHFETETIHSLIDRFSLSILSAIAQYHENIVGCARRPISYSYSLFLFFSQHIFDQKLFGETKT